MIRIKRDGSTVQMDVEADIPNYDTRIFFLRWEAGSPVFAGLLVELLRTKLGERLRAIRQRAYDRGWADAKAKRKRSTQYFTTMDDV